MQIVVSHNSLDFDALAAQLAVAKLNPNTRIALSSPVLDNMRDFLTLYRNYLPLVPMKHIRDKEKEISKIFIVDCQHLNRLDPIIQNLIQAKISYSIYDHHEFDEQGLGIDAQTDSIIGSVGASTTLLVEKIEKKAIKLSSFEASLLLLGIYEDTGALTYATTTHRDAACAAFLLRHGADLQVVNEYMRTKLNQDQQSKNIQPELTAAQIMQTSVKMILPSVSMNEAGKIMIRHNLDVLLVAEQEKILGVISKRDVDQAEHHGLGHAPVSGFMSRPVITVKPETTFSEIQSILVNNNIGRLPVLDQKGILLGIVCRQDILQTLFKNSSSLSSDERAGIDLLPEKYSAKNKFSLCSLAEPLAKLDPDTLWLYREIGEIATQLNMVAYAVGGSVRDMLLGLDNFDLDFVIEGSAISLADKLIKKHPHRFILSTKHERFQTATLTYITDDKIPEQRIIDLSTARQEFYEYPAALPTVEPSFLKDDLFRRDFTINTLALSLAPTSFGTLVNYFNGLEDLQAGIIRVLHQFSFIEDPTRILRAVRFASRFAFKIDDNTAQLASHAIEMGIFDNLAGVRMREELRLILESSSRLEALKILSSLGARLRYLDEELEYGIQQRKLLRRAQQLLCRYPVSKEENWLVYLALLLSKLSPARLENVLAHLHLTSEARHSIIRGLALDEELLRLGKNPKRSAIYLTLHTDNDTTLAIASCLSAPGSPARRAIKLYYEELKNIKTFLTGQDLLQIGFKEGRELGQVLQSLLNAKLDQAVDNRQDELDFVRTELATR